MKPEKIIPKRISRAIMEYDLISEGDRVLLALSGGKDSMAMARLDKVPEASAGAAADEISEADHFK